MRGPRKNICILQRSGGTTEKKTSKISKARTQQVFEKGKKEAFQQDRKLTAQEVWQDLGEKGDLDLEVVRGQEKGGYLSDRGESLAKILKMTGGLMEDTNWGSQEQLDRTDGEFEREEKGGSAGAKTAGNQAATSDNGLETGREDGLLLHRWAHVDA